jgi:lipoprotein-releasing system permease protein
MTYGNKSSGVQLRGISPDAEARVVDLRPHLLSGSLSALVPGSYRVILGKALADELGVKVGDRVVLIVALGDVTPLGVLPRMRAFEVAGLISVGMYEYDRRIAITAIQDAAKLLRMGDDVTGLRLNLADMYAAPRISRAAALAIGGGVEIQDWTNEHINFFRSIQITKRILGVILSLMVAVAAFNIVSTMVMVVKDKRRDIAILRTFGSSPRSILSVFVVQGSLIGMLGILAGVAFGVLIAVNLQELVHGLEAVVGFKFLDARVYFMSDLPAHVRLGDVVRICAFAFVLACVSTVYPAVRAARLLPAESLRND